MAHETRQATFGGGCFWCTEAVFGRLDGVLEVVSGYAGGHAEAPTYEQICTGTTGHAEVVQVTYDPARIAYADLLEVFFKTHDPTTVNRQGADVGTQYRSIVLTHDEEQERVIREVIAELEGEGAYGAPIVTEVVPLDRFWPAEAYHHDYYRRNRRQPYCQVVIDPKLAKFRRHFADARKADPAPS